MVEVTTDPAPAYLRVLDELLAAACHVKEEALANNAIDNDHERLKARLRPMRGLKRLRCAARRKVSVTHHLKPACFTHRSESDTGTTMSTT